MSKKRVHEIAKEQGISSKDLLEKLNAAGVAAKAAASSVEETDALRALGVNGASATATASKPSAPAPAASASP
ncbi:MAG: translation initiation factor IF-2 N-terminal domain-containing protein, partial [Solirubrobacteraceae bacterium]